VNEVTGFKITLIRFVLNWFTTHQFFEWSLGNIGVIGTRRIYMSSFNCLTFTRKLFPQLSATALGKLWALDWTWKSC